MSGQVQLEGSSNRHRRSVAQVRIAEQHAVYIDRERLRPLFQRREYIEWRALAILMLAQRATEQDRKYIEDSFDDCSKFSQTANLAAWATAYIELNGASAIERIERIEREYLGNPRRSEKEVRAIVAALSLHGHDGRTDLRDQIRRSYDTAIRIHPAVSEQIAKDRAKWRLSRMR